MSLRRTSIGIWQTVKWSSLISESVSIPMSQRSYEWKIVNVQKFLQDMLYIFDETKHSFTMGCLIIYNGQGENEIYDGQQRTITTFIILCVIAIICKSKGETDTTDHIFSHIIENNYKHKRSKSLAEKYENGKKMPKIHCISPEDDDALDDILNVGYVRDKDETNNIKLAFEEIYKTCSKWDINKLDDFHKFILKNIEIQTYTTGDYDDASRLFEWTNNRGKPLNQFDIQKNILLSRIPKAKRREVYDKWEEMKNKPFGKNLLISSLQIYNKNIGRAAEPDISIILRDDDTYEEFNKLLLIYKKVSKIYDEILNDKFVRLCSLKQECFMYCLLPISYTSGKVVKKLTELICKVIIRNIGSQSRLFNPLAYSTHMIEICNQYIKDSSFDYYSEFEKLFRKLKDPSILVQNYVTTRSDQKMNPTKAKTLLLFIETKISPDDSIVKLTYDLEHICPKVSKGLNIDLLGNLTLLEGKKSSTGQKGNRSLGDADFSIKKNDYEKSDCRLTREVSKLNTFTDAELLERNIQLYEQLNTFTEY